MIYINVHDDSSVTKIHIDIQNTHTTVADGVTKNRNKKFKLKKGYNYKFVSAQVQSTKAIFIRMPSVNPVIYVLTVYVFKKKCVITNHIVTHTRHHYFLYTCTHTHKNNVVDLTPNCDVKHVFRKSTP